MHDRTEPGWRKSSKSGGGNCVEIKEDGNRTLMRDSKDRFGPVLAFDRDAFQAFVADLKAGHLFPA
jgi:hypothetical protein